jgi:peptide/nickel transport system permease protein
VIDMGVSRAVAWSLAERFFQSLVTLWLVTVLFFLITELAPGDFAVASASQGMSSAEIQSTRFRLGLYDSAPERYFRWIAALLQGDLGMSWWADLPVAPLVGERLWHSAWLFAWASLITVPIALGLALGTVIRRGGLFDRGTSLASVALISIPDFVIAYGLIIVLALKFDLFPTYTLFALDMSLGERLHASALPIMSLAAVTITPMFRLSRAALINVYSTEYIQMAEIKGLDGWRILYRHALPNAAGPIANAIALTLGHLFFGLVIIEIIFSYPGLGSLLVTAASHRDMPLVLACSLISAVVFISANFLADSIGLLANPRVRFPSNPGTGLLASVRWRAGRIYSSPRFTAVAGLGLLILFTGAAVDWSGYGKYDAEALSVAAPVEGARDKLTMSELLGQDGYKPEFIHNGYFMPLGETQDAVHELQGILQVPEFKVLYRRSGGTAEVKDTEFPAFETRLVTRGDVLLPLERDSLLESSFPDWGLILSPGKIWREVADGDWSRGSLPITFIGLKGQGPHYAIATFAFNGKTISQFHLQIAQETANWAQFDVWGQTPVNFIPKTLAGAQEARDAYGRILETRLDVRPWSELAAEHWRSLERFDGEGNRRNITVSGLMIDDVFYLRTCRTRAGPHPYCRQMRHGVYSITKTLGAAVGMLWLAKEYGPEVFDEKIADYVSIPAKHDGWKDVTFRHALDMVTGIGNVVPERVDEYVEADATTVSNNVWRADSLREKLDAVAAFKNYSWGPGEVFRYRTSDTSVLSAAMQAYLKRKLGPQADLWDSVTEEVLLPLGIDRLPVLRTLEPDGRRGTALFGTGMFVTIEDALKLARLFQNHGRHGDKQLLHRELTARAVSNGFSRGYPNGWRTRDGEGHYEMGFWLTPQKRLFRCKLRIPVMAGFGGNYLIVMPNRTIGLRFADGHDNDRHTWDSSGIRHISDRIRPFC